MTLAIVPGTVAPAPVNPETARADKKPGLFLTLLGALVLLLSGFGGAHAQTTATINWTDVHQVIDGFGASDAFAGPLSSADLAFFFGTGTGQLGLSILRTGAPNNGDMSGDCTTVNVGCAGPYVSDMKAAIANGARIYSSPWTPPPAYKTNGLNTCTGNAGLITSDYAAYATWLANYVMSLKTEEGITLYALSVQNEPNECLSYDSAYWTAAEIDTFVATNLGPTFAADGLSTLIYVPEGSGYNEMSLGSTCATDSSCNEYIGGVVWHDYDANLTGTNTITADPYPSDWPAGKKYWETEASCGSGFGPNFCQTGFNTDITDALDWAAVIDQRIAVDNANAWLYWWLVGLDSTDDQALVDSNGTIAKRAYMLGQYSKFVRPGYFRIDATHLPATGVSVSAYQNTATSSLVIIATNYTGSDVSQEFSITNAPTFSSLTPYTTSASLSLAKQSSVSLSSNSFTYKLPANSITTFASSASSGPTPTATATATPTATSTGATPTATASATPTATPTPVGMVTINPSSLDFGTTTTVGKTSKSKTVDIKNDGNKQTGPPVTIEMETASPSVFAVKSQCKKTLKPGKSCKVSVTFKPVDDTTAETGSLMIFDNATGSPQSVGLSGTGKAPKTK
ncbi:choice-of-anchor D domain-containing protein [Candidatus Binatus sp.]|uniref:choice-of-anchor D domain-containing protein n=1 Tax=Candidatus Binatus sp. TaxID=2811406 RepID=UPI003C5E8A0A